MSTEEAAGQETEQLRDLVLTSLEDMKAREVRVLDVRNATAITDLMVVASGTSARHVKAIGEQLLETTRESGVRALGVEGLEAGEWVLLDFADVVVHVMIPEIRDFYNLEKLWSMD